MKKYILFSVLILVSLYVSAQTRDTDTKPRKSGNEWHSINDALPRTQEFTNRLKKELGLDDNISKKVYDAFLANTKSLDEIKMGVAEEPEKIEQLKINKEAFNETLKKILTGIQFDKYLKMPEDKTWKP